MKRIRTCITVILMALVLSTGISVVLPEMAGLETQAAAVKISKKKITLEKGKKYQLKISGTKKKVTWKSNKPAVVSVNSKGKITAKKKGMAKITAKVGGKKYTCTVTVKSKNNPIVPEQTEPQPEQTEPQPEQTEPQPEQTEQPEKSARDVLKEYIAEYGKENANGDKVITMIAPTNGNLYTYGITYEEAENNFVFVMVGGEDGSEYAMSMAMPYAAETSLKAEFTYLYRNMSYTAEAAVNMKTYDRHTNAAFRITSVENINMDSEGEALFTKLADEQLITSMVGWDIQLTGMVKINMRDIGFLSYDPVLNS